MPIGARKWCLLPRLCRGRFSTAPEDRAPRARPRPRRHRRRHAPRALRTTRARFGGARFSGRTRGGRGRPAAAAPLGLWPAKGPRRRLWRGRRRRGHVPRQRSSLPGPHRARPRRRVLRRGIRRRRDGGTRRRQAHHLQGRRGQGEASRRGFKVGCGRTKVDARLSRARGDARLGPRRVARGRGSVEFWQGAPGKADEADSHGRQGEVFGTGSDIQKPAARKGRQGIAPRGRATPRPRGAQARGAPRRVGGVRPGVSDNRAESSPAARQLGGPR
mmetsp:Transcript_26429/g.88883  ORF Transcript_26429/g.88883 Transcript_26429/m.88883 type:complete len:274 (+) Transcript_26429:1269-2090(+)